MKDFLEIALQGKDGGSSYSSLIATALLLVLVGWAVASIAFFVVRRLVQGLNDFIVSRFGAQGSGGRKLQNTALKVIPRIVYWFLIIFFVALATELLGLPVFSSWLSRVMSFLPQFLTSVIILFGGLWCGIFLRDMVTRMAATAKMPYAEVLGRICQFSVVIVSVVVAVGQLGINLSFLTTISAVLLAGPLLAGALAFGLGAQTMVRNILACHYTQKLYRVGNVIEIDGVRGTIVKITGTFIVIETHDGQVAIPAQEFTEKRSMLVNRTNGSK